MEWPDPALKVRDRARFTHSTACSPRLCDDACRVPAELGARGATAPAREGAGAAAAGGRTARQPAQQRPAQRPPAQQPDQPVRALRGEYCRPAALRRPGGSTRSNFASRARAEAPAARARPAAREKYNTEANPVDFVFHGGSGSTLEEIREAIGYGVIKMNIDTDLQFAFTEGIRDYMNDKIDYLRTQIGNPDGADQPNKKHYDPRKWLREGEVTFKNRLIQAFKDLNNVNTL